MNRHPGFFDDPAHIKRVEQITDCCRDYLRSWDKIYTTARFATKRSSEHTEIKFSNISLPTTANRVKLRQAFVAKLEALGVDASDIVPKPNTRSYSVRVR